MKVTKIAKEHYVAEVNNRKFKIGKKWIFWTVTDLNTNVMLCEYCVKFKDAKATVLEIINDPELEKRCIETAKVIELDRLYN